MVGAWSVRVGFLYTNTEIFPLFHFDKVSINASSPLLSSFIVNLKAHDKYLKNGVSKNIVRVIKHANFQLYRVHPDGVI